jgi:threonyl-tRNA synthetase
VWGGSLLTASDGTDKPVAVIHRAPLGSHECFVGFLTEHFGGAFPVWFAPEQVRIIPVMPDLLDYAFKVRETLFEAGLRVDVDAGDSRLNAKVRSATIRKVPLTLVVGRREAEEHSVSVRYRSGEETSMNVDAFVDHALEMVRSKSLEGAGHLRPAGESPERV